jgi:glycerophosphoryl diester phosphodiesterase
MTRNPPIIVAHRRLHRDAAENSLDAFRAAEAAKVPWVECDVWPSSDGVPVVIHDQTLDRTTTARGNVADHSAEQLRQLGVPSLLSVMDVLAHIGLLVEIKPLDTQFMARVATLLSRYPGPWMVQSFHLKNLLFLHAPKAFLTEDAAILPGALQSDLRVHPHHSLIDKSIVEAKHQLGGEIGAWTVNAGDDIQRMIDLGIDMLITDEPELALRMTS